MLSLNVPSTRLRRLLVSTGRQIATGRAAAQLEERRRDRRAAVLHAHAVGASVQQIAEAAGISPQRMSQIVSNPIHPVSQKTRVPLKKRFKMPDTFAKLHEEAGQTMAEYAVVLGVITIAVVVTLGLLSTAIQSTLSNVIASL
jgi:Flp pilus assembly pilin Flp